MEIKFMKTRHLKYIFARYYKKPSIYEPPEFDKREFAFVYFENPDSMQRHMGFSSLEELMMHIEQKIPRHIYYSSAIYEYPSAVNMNEKEWLGAELVFDIDVDHIDTPCKKLHDRWICLDCGANGWGLAPQACYKCGSERIRKETWVCETCISVAKDESLKLIDFLISDFGFRKNELLIVFSGHRGFHIHIYNEKILELNQEARREIADYVRGIGINYKMFIPVKGSLIKPYNPDFWDPAWLGRVSRALYNLFTSINLEENLKKIGIADRTIKKISSLKQEIIKKLEEKPPNWNYLSKVIDENTWEIIFHKVAEEEGAKIDERVTIDIKRLIRLPGSLHGKTGMKVSKIDYHGLENFDIRKHAVVFADNPVKVDIKNPPQKILDVLLEAKKGVVKVPYYIYVYLLANGAEVRMIKSTS